MNFPGLKTSRPLSRRSFLCTSTFTVAKIGAAALLPVGRGFASMGFSSYIPAGTVESFLNVRSFGALGDGTHIDSEAVNQAIQAASRAGGGTVVFPSGSYLCFSIRLASHITLLLQPGCVLIAAESGRLGSYDLAEGAESAPNFQDFGHRHWHNSLIWGEGLEHVAIVGEGTIWGRGLTDGLPQSSPAAETMGVGNKALALKNCKNVQLRNFSILKGGHFGILATGVDNLLIDGLTIDTDRDGMDLDCCRNVRVTNCSVNSADDAICVKSSFALGYGRPTQDLAISNCYVTAAYRLGTMLNATWEPWIEADGRGRNGGIKFGTESNGGFINSAISNCVFEGCHGLSLETVDGARLEDLVITNITMRDLVSPPLFLRLGARMRGPAGSPVGTMKHVRISGIIASHMQYPNASTISGIPAASIEDLSIVNVQVEHGGSAQGPATLPENERSYPEYSMFGSTTPAQGFYVRHVRGFHVRDVDIQTTKEDVRPLLVLDSVAHADIRSLRSNSSPGTLLASLTNVSDITFSERNVSGSTYIRAASKQSVR